MTVTAVGAKSDSKTPAVVAGIAVPLGVLFVAALSSTIALFRLSRKQRRRLLEQEHNLRQAQVVYQDRQLSPGYCLPHHKSSYGQQQKLDPAGFAHGNQLAEAGGIPLAEAPGFSSPKSVER